MKFKIAVALAALLFVLILRREENEPAFSSETQQVAKVNGARGRSGNRIVHRKIPVTAQPQLRRNPSLAEIEAEPDAERQSELLDHAVQSVSDADLEATLDSLTGNSSMAAAEFRKRLVRRWAETDAPSAAKWLAQFSDSAFYNGAIEQVAIAWAGQDFAAASAWVQALPENEGRQIATLGMAYEAARLEPLNALRLAMSLPATAERDGFLVHGVSQWGNDDHVAAASWAAEVSDTILRERLLAAIAIAHAEQDGAAAATLAATSLRGETLERAAVAIVQRWAQQSPADAASWILQLPDSSARDAAMKNLVTLWAGQSPEAAANWLNELPGGALRELGERALAKVSAQ